MILTHKNTHFISFISLTLLLILYIMTLNGFFGPNSWYMNHLANRAYARQAPNAGQLALPVLFLGARYDSTCETTRSRLTEPMLAICSNLSQAVLDTGHWMAQEDPAGVNRELVKWLVKQVL